MNEIRPALSSDASSILDIYAPYILNTTVSFETEVPTIKDFSQRIIANGESWPWLVYESDGLIAGYAYASKHRETISGALKVPFIWMIVSNKKELPRNFIKRCLAF